MSDLDPDLASARHLSWHGPIPPAERLAEAARYAQTHGIAGDRYGTGSFLRALETEVARVLGMEDGLFLATGGAAQLIATRVWSERTGQRTLAMHPRSHVELREGRGYARVNGLVPRWLGDPHLPLRAEDLRGVEAGTLLVELPLRALGGALPSWDTWQRIRTQAHAARLPLHVDGARIWEAAAAYARPPAELLDRVSSVYVSFYKGLGSTSGALLAGSHSFIEEARSWRERFGARVVELYPLAIPARLGFELRRHRFAAYHARARELADALRPLPGLTLRPDPPHTNMFHVDFRASEAALLAARDRVARDQGIWLFGFFAEGLEPGTRYGEVVIGDAAELLSDAEIRAAFEAFLGHVGEASPSLPARPALQGAGPTPPGAPDRG